jgi:hypothetical protein
MGCLSMGHSLSLCSLSLSDPRSILLSRVHIRGNTCILLLLLLLLLMMMSVRVWEVVGRRGHRARHWADAKWGGVHSASKVRM